MNKSCKDTFGTCENELKISYFENENITYKISQIRFSSIPIIIANSELSLSIKEIQKSRSCNPTLLVTWSLPRRLIVQENQFILSIVFNPLGVKKSHSFLFNISSDQKDLSNEENKMPVQFTFDCYPLIYPGTEYTISLFNRFNEDQFATGTYKSNCQRPEDYNIDEKIEIGLVTSIVAVSLSASANCYLNVYIKSFPKINTGTLNVNGVNKRINLTCPIIDSYKFVISESGEVTISFHYNNNPHLHKRYICMNAIACSYTKGECISDYRFPEIQFKTDTKDFVTKTPNIHKEFATEDASYDFHYTNKTINNYQLESSENVFVNFKYWHLIIPLIAIILVFFIILTIVKYHQYCKNKNSVDSSDVRRCERPIFVNMTNSDNVSSASGIELYKNLSDSQLDDLNLLIRVNIDFDKCFARDK